MKYPILFLMLFLTVTVISTSDSAAFSGNGSGASGDPYQITDVDELQEMNDELDACYILMNNINASATSGWNGGEGFVPIGPNWPNSFTGSFDGRGYAISNLYINRPSTDYVGLFGCVGVAGSITNTGLENVDITGCEDVGGFCGENNGSISDCYTSGSVSNTDDELGGFCGDNRGSISDCYSTANVSGTDDEVGGFCGDNVDGYIVDCYCTGDVSSFDEQVGGFCGENGSVISGCYSTGDVSGEYNDVGGFCGDNDCTILYSYSTGDVIGTGEDTGGFCGDSHCKIANCYSTGGVTGDDYTGGFCGYNMADITNCYSTGAVSSNSNTGGFCELNEEDINNCFWDTESSGILISDGGVGKTTAEMKTQSTFTSAGWNFTLIWSISPGQYPKLRKLILRDEVWVNDSYCGACSNDGHIWGYDAFKEIHPAYTVVSPGGIIHVESSDDIYWFYTFKDFTIEGDIFVGYEFAFSGNMVTIDGGNVTIGEDPWGFSWIYGAGEDANFRLINGGRLILYTSSPVTFPISFGDNYRPCIIDAPAGNAFSVGLYSWRPFAARCYWDIEHVGGAIGGGAKIELIYEKNDVPDYAGDMSAESYLYHFNGSQWDNITPGDGSGNTSDWTDNTSYYSTTVSGISEFSPFAPVGALGLIPTLTQWAAIIMGGLLVIFGAWFILKRIV